MATYHTLIVERDYLKNIGQLASSPTDGVLVQADLTRAEQEAFDEINSFLSADYDVSGWAASVPPIIDQIANLLGAANVWMMRHGSDSMGQAGNPQGLRDWALKKIEAIKAGSMDIRLADGSIQSRRLGGGHTDIV